MRLRKTAEIVIGVLYAIGAVHQAFFVLPESREFYVAMAASAWIRPAQIFVEDALVPNSAAVTALVVVSEATLAIAILSRGSAVRWALVAGGVFSIVGALTGSPAETIGFGLLAAIHFWLARDRWDTALPAEQDS
ncbi:MAG: hypothetical protein WBN93_11560 [Acidimicrobiia bacterium]